MSVPRHSKGSFYPQCAGSPGSPNAWLALGNLGSLPAPGEGGLYLRSSGFPLTSHPFDVFTRASSCPLEPPHQSEAKTKDLPHPFRQGVDEDLGAHKGTSFSWRWDLAGPHTSVWAILGVQVSSSTSSRQGLRNIPEPCGSVCLASLYT